MVVIEAKRRGTLPLAPCSLLLGCREPHATEGHSGLSLPATSWLASPSGTVYGGVLALFADIVLTGAATTVLGAGLICSPLDLKVQFLLRSGRRCYGSARPSIWSMSAWCCSSRRAQSSERSICHIGSVFISSSMAGVASSCICWSISR